jgi:hydrogenase expression/formation protein HypC
MCLALPRKILSVEADRVLVEWDDGPLWASSGGVPDLQPGEYVLVHAGLVLERVSEEEAEGLLALYAELAADGLAADSLESQPALSRSEGP